jgi:FixJ family two-component response regulator
MATPRWGKVIVVEDDQSMREAIETLLDAAGIESATYESAEALLADPTTQGARCIVSDLKLPGMSGLELMSVLRARGNESAVIVITAHDSAEVRGEAKRGGAAAYLAKPFLGSALLTAIERVCSHDAGPSTRQ